MFKGLYNSRFNYGLGPLDSDIVTRLSIMRSQLMATGLWAKLTDVFPLAGTSSAACAINIRNPPNRLTFASGELATFSKLGYSSNSSGFATCATAPQILSSFSMYLGVNATTTPPSNDVRGLTTVAPFVVAANSPGVCYTFSDGVTYSDLFRNTTGRVSTGTPGATSYTGTRSAGGTHRLYSNGILRASAAANTDALADINFWVLGSSSLRTYNFLAFGLDMTASDVLQLDQIIKIYRA